MKKSTLLSFATAAAIVVTSAGTYAAWDKTIAVSEPGIVNFKQVTLNESTSKLGNLVLDDRAVKTKPTAHSTVKFDIKDEGAYADNLEMKVKIYGTKDDSGTEVTDTTKDYTSKFEIKLYKGNSNTPANLITFADSKWSVDKDDFATAVDKVSSNEYYVEITPTDAVANAETVNGEASANDASIIEKNLHIEVTAELTTTPVAP